MYGSKKASTSRLQMLVMKISYTVSVLLQPSLYLPLSIICSDGYTCYVAEHSFLVDTVLFNFKFMPLSGTIGHSYLVLSYVILSTECVDFEVFQLLRSTVDESEFVIADHNSFSLHCKSS